MKKYFAELIGTYFLVLFGTGSVVLSQSGFSFVDHTVISISFGVSVFLMILLFGKLSGSHINPAVTVCLAIDNKFRWRDVLPYVIFQLIGAILASSTLHLLFPQNEMLGSTLPRGSEMQSFLLEIFLMFILMITILNASSKLIISALLIGSVVGFEAYFAGPICGASMNPARSIGPAVISGHYEHLWIYILAPMLGGVLAIFSLKALKKNEL
jgi:aquaporin Z